MVKMDPDYYVTLREYFDYRLEASTRAIDIAYASMEDRLAAMQAAEFVTRAELKVTTSRIDSELAGLRESRAELRGKASQQSVVMSYVLSAIGIVLSVISIIVRFI